MPTTHITKIISAWTLRLHLPQTGQINLFSFSSFLTSSIISVLIRETRFSRACYSTALGIVLSLYQRFPNSGYQMHSFSPLDWNWRTSFSSRKDTKVYLCSCEIDQLVSVIPASQPSFASHLCLKDEAVHAGQRGSIWYPPILGSFSMGCINLASLPLFSGFGVELGG